MLLEKEYPATHSMSTAWYLVDEDDNVGMMDFNEDGPIPHGVPYEYSFGTLLFGEGLSDEFDEGHGCIQLTEAQLKDILPPPIPPEEIGSFDQIIVQVDPDKEEAFLECCARLVWIDDEEDEAQEITICKGCISKETHCYFLEMDGAGFWDKANQWHYRPAFQEILDERMILAVYPVPEFYLSDQWDGEKPVFTKHFDKVPYYIYGQPYWSCFPQSLVHIPAHPVKLSQVQPDKRHLILRIPGRFSDRETMQIAQWYLCKGWSYSEQEYVIDGKLYYPFPLEDGSRIYVQFMETERNKQTFGWIPIPRGDLCQALLADSSRYAYSIEEIKALEESGQAIRSQGD